MQELSELQKAQARENLGFGNGEIDEVPTSGSDRLVKSGGVFKSTENISIQTYDKTYLTTGSCFDLRTVAVGEVYTGVTYTYNSGSRLRVALGTGSQLTLRTGVRLAVSGFFNGYIVTRQSDDVIIEKYISPTQTWNTTENPIIYTAETDVYVYINCESQYYDQFLAQIKGVVIVEIDRTKDVDFQSVNETQQNFATLGYLKYPLALKELNITENKILQKTGNEIVFNGWYYTDFIEVAGGSVVLFGNALMAEIFGCYYDSSQNYLGGITGPNSYKESYAYNVPADAKYLRINSKLVDNCTFTYINVDDKPVLDNLALFSKQIVDLKESISEVLQSISIKSSNKIAKPLPLNSGNIWLSFGDSITWGVSYDSTYPEGNIVDANNQKYKYIEVLTSRFGMTLRNSGESNSTATHSSNPSVPWMYNKMQNVITAWQDDAPAIISIAIGVNDFTANNAALGNINNIVGTSNELDDSTFYGCLDKEIKLVKSTWPNAAVIVITPIMYYKPQNYANPLSSFRKAAHDVALLNDCSVIDGLSLPFPEGSGVLQNILAADGLHPTSLGHKMMGEAIAGIIG